MPVGLSQVWSHTHTNTHGTSALYLNRESHVYRGHTQRALDNRKWVYLYF